MFRNQRHGASGLGAILGVTLVLAGFLATTGLLIKSYREGGQLTQTGCELVCRQAQAAAKG